MDKSWQSLLTIPAAPVQILRLTVQSSDLVDHAERHTSVAADALSSWKLQTTMASGESGRRVRSHNGEVPKSKCVTSVTR